MCGIILVRGNFLIGAIVMRKREFTNRMSLRGEQESSMWQSRQNKLIIRDSHVSPLDFLRMTTNAVILGQQRVTRVSKDIKWTFGASSWVMGERKRPRMICVLWILVSCVSMEAIARAECVPTPDCGSIGYAETFCEGKSLKCPFDTSKLFCVPCDSAYKYTCNGNNIVGGSGSPCNGKYVICTCSDGFEWNGNDCIKSGGCTVGMIYYTDKTCSSSYDGSKTVVGIVVKDYELIMSKPLSMQWSSDYDDIIELTNITSVLSAKADMNGKTNTSAIVSLHANLGETISSSAALYCNNYTGGLNETLGQWYLPAAGELYNYVYSSSYYAISQVSTILDWSGFGGVATLWSSSEYSYGDAWFLNCCSFLANGKTGSRYVSCFLAIN